MKTMRFPIFGTGFWSRYQLAAWRELEGAECVALFNRTKSKADALAEEFGVSTVYDDANQLLETEDLGFIDTITDVGTHSHFATLAAQHSLPERINLRAVCAAPFKNQRSRTFPAEHYWDGAEHYWPNTIGTGVNSVDLAACGSHREGEA